MNDQRGTTLIELLVAMAILGLGIAALLGALAVGIRASDEHRKQATSNTVLTAAAEAIKDPARTPYQRCATTYSLANQFDVPVGWSVVVTGVVVVSPITGATYSPAASPCVENNGQYIQEVTIQATDPLNKTSSITIGKRQ